MAHIVVRCIDHKHQKVFVKTNMEDARKMTDSKKHRYHGHSIKQMQNPQVGDTAK